jgi:hypothetical protein
MGIGLRKWQFYGSLVIGSIVHWYYRFAACCAAIALQ